MPTTIPIEHVAYAIELTGPSLEELPGINGAYRELMSVVERVAATREDVLDLEGVANGYLYIASNEMTVVALEVGRRFGAAGVLLDDVTVGAGPRVGGGCDYRAYGKGRTDPISRGF